MSRRRDHPVACALDRRVAALVVAAWARCVAAEVAVWVRAVVASGQTGVGAVVATVGLRRRGVSNIFVLGAF